MMSDIRLEIEKLRNQLHTEIQEVKSDLRVNIAQIADLQHSVYWGFAIIGIIIAFFGLFKKNEKKQTFTENEVIEIRSLIRDEFARLKAGN